MRAFRVMIRGENFYLEMDEVVQRLGFYTTRFVEARDEEEAEQRAIDSLRQHAWLRSAVRNERDDPPMLFAEEVAELEGLTGDGSPNDGFTFFPDDSSVH